MASFLSSAPVQAEALAVPGASGNRTWKTVTELSPEERANIDLSPELRARVQAQEQAGRLVFVGEEENLSPTNDLLGSLSK